MSLPTSKPAQASIRSFFQAKPPKYAPPKYAPPPSLNDNDDDDNNDNDNDNDNDNNNNNNCAPPPPSSLYPNRPREASIRSITADDINPLRRLNALLLPLSYPDTFYQRAADPVTGRFSRVITWAHDGQDAKIVGSIVCRVEPAVDTKSAADLQVPQTLYIQSLGLLSPYRSMGLIAAALDNVIAAAVTDPSLGVKTVMAHVWTENEEGLHWYEARGFKRWGLPIKGYYLKLRPDSAWLVSRPVGASVRSALPSSSPTPPPPQPRIPSTTAALVNLPPVSAPSTASSDAGSSRSARPPLRVTSGQSYQNQRAETEWNDLPADMASSLLAPPKKNGSEPGSSASSRSSSTARKKRDRSYPAAAFGS